MRRNRAFGWGIVPAFGWVVGCNTLLDIQVFPDDSEDAGHSPAVDADHGSDATPPSRQDAAIDAAADDARIRDATFAGDTALDASLDDIEARDAAGVDATLVDVASDSSASVPDAATDSSPTLLDASDDVSALADSSNDSTADTSAGDSSPQDAGCGDACCATPSGTNLVQNGGFDMDTSGWTVFDPTTLTFVKDDSTGCPSSGSALSSGQSPDFVNSGFLECVTVTPSQSYNVGARVLVPSGGPSGGTFLLVTWFTGPQCSGSATDGVEIEQSGDFDVWESMSREGVIAPDDAVSAEVYAKITTPTADTYVSYFDMIYLSPSPFHF